MKRRDLPKLFLLSLAVRLAVAALIPRPGYMDAAYYAAGAVRMAQGGGFSEPFIWNYLSEPAGIAHPGYLYWMPLPALLAAPFAALWPGSFLALQMPFAILSALLPLVAYGLAWQVTRRRRLAWAAGLITLFSGFFFPYWSLPETFAPFALAGSLALCLTSWGRKGAGAQGRRGAGEQGSRGAREQSGGTGLLASCLLPLASGLLVGLAHLTRADGVLLLPVVALAPLLLLLLRNTRHASSFVIHHSSFIIRHSSFVILGYLLVMGPWFLRNLSVIGAPLSPAGTKTLWLTNYDDLFCYDCPLSPDAYLAWGWRNVLRSKLFALWTNFQRFLAEDCLIFLFPFAVVGFYRLRRRPPFALAIAFLFLITLVHSLAFTFPGWRGGFFHSSSALLPFLYAAAMEGLDAAIGWAARRRGWRRAEARAVFSAAMVVAAAALSLYVTAERLPAWRRADAIYREIDRWLAERGEPEASVMVGNPPAFWYHTGRPAVVLPNGDVETLLTVADRYRVRYVLLDRNRPAPLGDLDVGEALPPRLQPEVVWAEREAALYSIKQ